jgi:hypothetical protein
MSKAVAVDSIPVRWILFTLCLFGARMQIAGQTPAPSATTAPGNGYRIAGTVVSKIDGHPLAQARVTVQDTQAPNKFESVVTSEDGKFEFTGVPAGKYNLRGSKRRYISASYDEHERFSTAIVTGAGLETEALTLRLAPMAIIAGKILDESGDPARHATVTLYQNDHSSGVDQISQVQSAQTDDLGAYEMVGLTPGNYFLSASARPWYAPDSSSDAGSDSASPVPDAKVDRSLDVAYPLTYYPDVTDAESASPIPVRGGERLQIEIHLNPVPALRVFVRVPTKANGEHLFPHLQQFGFDGSTFLFAGVTHMVSPGLFEVEGVPAGRYNVRIFGQSSATQMSAVDLSKDGEQIDTSVAEAMSSVKISAQALGDATVPQHLTVALRSGGNRLAGVQQFNTKGEAEFDLLAPGRYEVIVWSTNKAMYIAHIAAEGAEVSGHSIVLAAGAPASVSVTVSSGSRSVEGVARKDGKPFAGAMVVLVPKNPDGNRDLFRRDQSDLDGTFALQDVVPGAYTVLAIENGWDLDWSQPAVIAAYSNRGRTIEVGNQVGRAAKLPQAVDVLSK